MFQVKGLHLYGEWVIHLIWISSSFWFCVNENTNKNYDIGDFKKLAAFCGERDI